MGRKKERERCGGMKMTFLFMFVRRSPCFESRTGFFFFAFWD